MFARLNRSVSRFSEIGSGLVQLLRGEGGAEEAHRVLRSKIAMIDARVSELRALRKELQARTKLDCPFVIKEGRRTTRRAADRLRR